MYGKKQTVDSNLKRSETLMGREITKEHRNKIATALSGKKKSARHCENFSKVRKGVPKKPFTQAHKDAIAKARTGIPRPPGSDAKRIATTRLNKLKGALLKQQENQNVQ